MDLEVAPLRQALSVFVLISVGTASAATPAPAGPPVAPKVPRMRTLHGETVRDDYFYLRDKKDKRTLPYLRAETAYADKQLAPLAPLRQKLRAEIVGRMREDDVTPPYRRGPYEYMVKEVKGREHYAYWRRALDADGRGTGPELLVLDLDALAKKHKFFALHDFVPSDDGRLLAYSADTDGHEDNTLFVKDLVTGKTLPWTVPRMDSVVWAKDGRTLLYTVEDAAKRQHRAYRHVLGEKKDALVYEEKDARFRVGVDRTLDGELILVTSTSHTQSETRLLPAGDPTAALTLVTPRSKEHMYEVEHRQGTLYIRTNLAAPDYRIVTAPLVTPGEAHWRDFLPARKDVLVEQHEVFQDFVVVTERENGMPELRVIELPSGAQHRVPVDEAVRDLGTGHNYVHAAKTFRYTYSSPITPFTYYDWDPATKQRTLVKRDEVPGGYDARRYEVQRLAARAADGEPISISLLSLKNLTRDGTSPMLLEGYGAYGLVETGGFDESVFSLVDRGVLYAWAHIRGGGELGKRWHEGGRMMRKKTTFSDFISAAEWLIANHYTSPQRLAIEGGSAGGLLMGAVVNMRPDLFRAAVIQVPFVDVINTMLDETIPLTVGEFEEWGNPKLEDHYRYMRGYAPYENIADGPYPAMLVTSALNDARAPFWEAAKWVAKVRALKTNDTPVYLKMDLSPAGHGGRSGRYEQIDELTYTYAFILSQLGIEK